MNKTPDYVFNIKAILTYHFLRVIQRRQDMSMYNEGVPSNLEMATYFLALRSTTHPSPPKIPRVVVWDSHVPWVLPRIIPGHIYSPPPPPLSKYPWIPMYPVYFPGSSLDLYTHPLPLVQVSRDSHAPWVLPRIIPGHIYSPPPPCPSIPGFPCTLGTSQDHPWTWTYILTPLVQVSRDSHVPRVLPTIIPGLIYSPPPPPYPSLLGFPCTLGTSQDHPWTYILTPPLSKYRGIPMYPGYFPGSSLDLYTHLPPLSKYPGIPMYPRYFPGSSLDILTPPLVQVSRDSHVPRVLPRIIPGLTRLIYT